MDDVVEKVGKQGGGWYNFAAESCQTKSGWKAIPVVLGVVPRHLQHGPLQEGRARAPTQDLG
jgi:hypothetical protein